MIVPRININRIVRLASRRPTDNRGVGSSIPAAVALPRNRLGSAARALHTRARRFAAIWNSEPIGAVQKRVPDLCTRRMRESVQSSR